MAVRPHRCPRIIALVVFSLLSAACTGSTSPEGGSTISNDSAAEGAVTRSEEPSATASAKNPTTRIITTTAPSTTTELPRPLVIHGTGDLNVDPVYIPALATEGYGHALSGLDNLFTTDDLTIVNLECTPSNIGTRQPRSFNFRCDPDALPVLFADGVDVVNLGNNHSMDYGPQALVDSLANIGATGLAVAELEQTEPKPSHLRFLSEAAGRSPFLVSVPSILARDGSRPMISRE